MFEIKNNTKYPVKVKKFEIRTNNTKLFTDYFLDHKLIQIKQVIEPGDSYIYGERGNQVSPQYSSGEIKKEVDDTSDIPSDEQISQWKIKYGCDAQKGSILLHQGHDTGNVVFPGDSGITPDKINDFIVGSQSGFLPIIEEIDFE